jgi:Flp pilus assembly protein TadD
LEAFAAQDYDRARQILEKLHAAHPGDDTVRKNLAVVYVTIGDKQAARALLQSGR